MPSLQSSQISAISRLFSTGVLREMSLKGRSPLFTRLAEESYLFDKAKSSDRVHDLFDTAFSVLRRKVHRHEYVYKSALTQNILLGVHSLQTASMLTEFRVGACRADLVILNGTATVYEIKSERDSLSKLERQIRAFREVFANVYVIAGENHVEAVVDAVPPDVGVMQLSNRHQISTLREALEQPDRTSCAAMFDSIRLGEAKQILERNGLKVPRVPNTELYSTLRVRFIELPPQVAQTSMVDVLKKTRNLMPVADLIEQLPRSLQSVAMSVKLRRADHSRLVRAVNASASEARAWA